MDNQPVVLQYVLPTSRQFIIYIREYWLTNLLNEISVVFADF